MNGHGAPETSHRTQTTVKLYCGIVKIYHGVQQAGATTKPTASKAKSQGRANQLGGTQGLRGGQETGDAMFP